MKKIALLLALICALSEAKRPIEWIEIPNVFGMPKNLVLEMIFNSKAKINGKWYGVGERALGYEIRAIHLQKVELIDAQGKKLILNFEV